MFSKIRINNFSTPSREGPFKTDLNISCFSELVIFVDRNRTVAFISTFACFLSRGFDQLRMGVISQTNLNVVGSHAGRRIRTRRETFHSRNVI
jgi:hypothetical protein